MFHRIKTAWKFLTGKYPVNKIPSVYVHDGDNPNRFVQLMYFRDEIIALDASGSIYKLSMWPYDRPVNFSIEKIADSPRGY